MAKKVAPKVARRAVTAVVSTATEVAPATLVAPEVAAAQMDVDLTVTKEWDGEDVVEAPSSLSPVPVWDKPGKYIEGIYRGKRENIGPNSQVMYDVETTDRNTGEVVLASVWGGAVLDNRMQLFEPPIGAKVFIQFLGYFPAKKNQNPARNFRLRYKEVIGKK